ncbi:hypothetical protein GCK72_022270 [Caenorhabditis remanei]|uniref:Caskin-2 n=1 Tax=Caenorhabditis remanei TaxID=31234 RepID=A0A6A5FTE9_CAERE|nr:hypothetical protein GCK72_022270 [Caenorhabditis remanei]KAF1745823.1 hypothetical protein GCK72_022270 [Caenorhabditis remanei]
MFSDLLSIPKRDLSDNEEVTPLHNAVKMGNTVMAKNFIDSKSMWIDEPDIRGQTALHLSITYGDTEMTSLLLKGGANVDAADHDGTTACHIACRDGMIDHFNLLIYYHADICSVDRAGRTPFDLACEQGQEKMLERLFICGLKKINFQCMDYFHTASALHLAADSGQVQVVSLLLDNNWYLNFTSESGSALHMAAGSGQIQVVRFLLKTGIDATITNSDGLTAYAWAKKNSGRNPITYKEIRFLLKNFHTFTNAIAVEDYCGVEANELSLSKGDQVWVIERRTSEVWKGIVFGRKGNSRSGFFQSRVIEEQKETRDKNEEILTTPKIETRKNHNKMSSRIAKSQKNPTSTFSKQASIPVVPRRSCSTIQYHDINRNTPTQMTSFGRTASCYGDTNNLKPNNAMTKSTSGSFGSDSFHVFNNGSRTSTPNPSNMYNSSSCLYPAKVENHYASIGSSSSQSSSGFESAKCSASTSASSFPSAGQSNESGCESAHSVRSVESGSGSSSSIHGLDDSLYRSTHEVDVTGMVQSGVPHAEILANWLDSINMNSYLAVFLKQGYDLQTIARCTPADLLSLGIKNPDHRKKLINDIHSWKIMDQWPSVVPNNSLRDLLELQWEDFEDIGVKRLGHLKRFGLTIKKLKDHQRLAASSLHPSQYAVHSNPSSYHVPQTYGYSTMTAPQRQQSGTTFRSNDPPPPAPSAPNRSLRASSDKIDYLSYQQNNWKSATTLPEAPPKPIFLSSKPKSTSDLLFGDDTPIRLNLVSTGKILSDISKLKKDEEEDQELDDPNECPPPPAPLHCNVGMHHISSSNLSSFNSSLSHDQFPFANENCGTIRYSSGRQTNAFDVPTSLPPLISDDHGSESSIGSSSKAPTIDEMLQDIQGAMDNLISPTSTLRK